MRPCLDGELVNGAVDVNPVDLFHADIFAVPGEHLVQINGFDVLFIERFVLIIVLSLVPIIP
jgi:hypothetical protein